MTKIAKYTLFDEITQHILHYYVTKINHKNPIYDENSFLTQIVFIELQQTEGFEFESLNFMFSQGINRIYTTHSI